MEKRIMLEFERGEKIIVELLVEKAPITCKAILEALPVSGTVVHAMWAGEEIFLREFPISQPLELENATNNTLPGDIACVSAFAKHDFPKKNITTFCIFYGKARARKTVDETVDDNVFARIRDIEAITKIARRIRWEGAEKLTIKPESSTS